MTRQEIYMKRWDFVKANLSEANSNPDGVADKMKKLGLFSRTTAKIDARIHLSSMAKRMNDGKGPYFQFVSE